jgi:hypothetical protein
MINVLTCRILAWINVFRPPSSFVSITCPDTIGAATAKHCYAMLYSGIPLPSWSQLAVGALDEVNLTTDLIHRVQGHE